MLFLKRLIGISRLIVEVVNDQNLSTESNLANWFLSYAQFSHFSERAVWENESPQGWLAHR